MLDIVERIQLAGLPLAARRIVERMGELLEGRTASPLPASNCPPVLPAPKSPDLQSLPPLLSTGQIARYLSLNVRTLRRKIRAGEFPAADIDSGTKGQRWQRSTVEAWCEEGGSNRAMRICPRRKRTA